MDKQKFLTKKAAEIRRDLLHVIFNARTGHTGGSLSSVDILTVLYYNTLRIDPANPREPDRDRSYSVRGIV